MQNTTLNYAGLLGMNIKLKRNEVILITLAAIADLAILINVYHHW